MAASYVITNKTTQIFFARSSCSDFYRLYKKESETLEKARNNFTDFFVSFSCKKALRNFR